VAALVERRALGVADDTPAASGVARRKSLGQVRM
jgi:hypothetical protein